MFRLILCTVISIIDSAVCLLFVPKLVFSLPKKLKESDGLREEKTKLFLKVTDKAFHISITNLLVVALSFLLSGLLEYEFNEFVILGIGTVGAAFMLFLVFFYDGLIKKYKLDPPFHPNASRYATRQSAGMWVALTVGLTVYQIVQLFLLF